MMYLFYYRILVHCSQLPRGEISVLDLSKLSLSPEQILELRKHLKTQAKIDPTVKKAVDYSERKNYRETKKEELLEKYPELKIEEERKLQARAERRAKRQETIDAEKERVRLRKEARKNENIRQEAERVAKSQKTTDIVTKAGVSEEFAQFVHKAMIVKRTNEKDKVSAFKTVLTMRIAGKYVNSSKIVQVETTPEEAMVRAESILISEIKENVEKIKNLKV